MSGALETAAGTFAIVGVADVVVRTGRELYHFLCEVSDASDEVKRLNECIWDTILLVDALRNCAQANVDVGIVASVQAAVRALHRELQSLKLVLAKFKGAKTAWSRIKYALDEKKVSKALTSLERSKSLLVNSLTIIYGESSASNLQNISTLITQIGTKADTLAQTLTSSLDTHQQAITAKLNIHGQHSLDRQDAHRQALQSHLDDHHQQHLAIDELHQQKLSEVQLNQANISARQERLIYTSKQTEKRLVLLKEKVQGASQSSTKNHQETRGLLRDEFKRLQTSLSKNFVCAKRSGNEVYFRGERPDKIIGYLLPIKDELNTTINQILAQSHHGVPIQEMLVLREEFQRLLGSSAQAEAARYSMSTATSFDEWHFPGQEGGPGTSAVERRKCRAQECEEPAGTENIVYEPRQMRKRAKLKTQTLSFATHAGKLHLFISQREPKGDDTRNSCDLGLSFTSRAQSFAIVDILFARSFLHQTRPRICTHLNVSTLVPNSQINIYWQLFNANPTIKDVDHAIRHGSINPYHIDHMGTNMILFYAANYGRVDVLQYLESQGIGITGLRQDDSIKEGLNDAQYCSVGDLYLGNKVLSTFQYVQHLVYDSAAILADLIVDFIHEYYGMHYFTSENSLILEGLLVNLHNEGYDCAKYRLGDIPSAEEFRWDRQTLCKLMLLLVEAGANMSGANHISTCHIPRLINYDFDIRMRWAFDDLLYAYMQAGSDVHALNDMKQTPSISARHLDFWPLWCQALQDSGKEIEEVLLAEGNEWLLADNWEDIFFEQFGECDCGNCDYGDSDCEDSDCEDSDDGHGDDEQSNDNPGSSRVGATKGASTSGAQSEL